MLGNFIQVGLQSLNMFVVICNFLWKDKNISTQLTNLFYVFFLIIILNIFIRSICKYGPMLAKSRFPSMCMCNNQSMWKWTCLKIKPNGFTWT
jgi:hypothetical protein